ncbi:hypothetical protein K227x_32300 [Rubripirellula lacrimiformis]|uniref:Winged helix-turn-helix domain-containing protein n=1 Tax=Rubripirellula lacrimiformis TaxID=1930273 RepID=A0A517NCH0_9BACT|nr:crosslink repair DNA glycosylase YcaQ family protein [Rubripirellula lacrimiformis]QDT04833.1 hypothetical protein K227x_32300 [Rubripirellula lacrimiformis]
MIELSSNHARRLVVAHQGLHKSHAFGRGTSALSACIERLGYIQIDTISVVHRAHHHTFWTRVPTYREAQLDTLQRERKVFEYWSHAAAYLPMQDYRYCLPYMNAVASGQKKHWYTPDRKVMAAVMRRIRSSGAAMARDFEASADDKQHFWGSKKPAKIALEQLFIEGKLMVSHREGFQKVFDLTERVLPPGLDTTTPSNEEFIRYLVQRTIQSQGIVTETEIGYLRKGTKADIKKQVQQMLADGEIAEVSVAGKPEVYYSREDCIHKASKVRVAKKVRLLSPFDNLVIQRKRVTNLFDFDYQIECYVPEGKRVYGYFCLPILYGDKLVGRLDPKADRKNRTLIVRNLVIEKTIKDVDAFVDQLARAIDSFARFNGCERTTVQRVNHKKIAAALADQLSCSDDPQ